jgi:hypothetical protein
MRARSRVRCSELIELASPLLTTTNLAALMLVRPPPKRRNDSCPVLGAQRAEAPSDNGETRVDFLNRCVRPPRFRRSVQGSQKLVGASEAPSSAPAEPLGE